jgi:hypothetical protein
MDEEGQLRRHDGSRSQDRAPAGSVHSAHTELPFETTLHIRDRCLCLQRKRHGSDTAGLDRSLQLVCCQRHGMIWSI